MSDLKGHYGCNQNGEHEKCSDLTCGIYNSCRNRNTTWFNEEENKRTKSDVIRAMNDEGLVKFLLDVELGKYQFTNHAYPFVKAMAWLQSEVKESEE